MQFCEAENDRLTEENRALVAYIELIDPKRDWRIEEIEKMRNEPEVREGRLVIQPILQRHREAAGNGETATDRYSVYGGQGLMRIGTGLILEDAKALAKDFDMKCAKAGLENPPARIEQEASR